MEPRLRASREQYSSLIDFMERNGDLSRPQSGTQRRLKGDRMWQELKNILNSLDGDVRKSSDEWKKVWADWKTETKEKYLSLWLEASGTGGGPGNRIVLTSLEERVVAVIGASAVVGQAGIREHGLNRPISEPSIQVGIAEEENALMLNDNELNITLATPSSPSLLCDTKPHQSITPNVVTPKLAAPTSTLATTPPLSPPTPPPVPHPPRPQNSSPTPNSRRQASASPVSTPRRTLLSARRNRGLIPFERAADRFAAVEQRRVEHEEARDRRLHGREIKRLRLEAERIRLEAERIDVAREHNRLLHQLSILGQRLIDVISQQRPFGNLPSTDPI